MVGILPQCGGCGSGISRFEFRVSSFEFRVSSFGKILFHSNEKGLAFLRGLLKVVGEEGFEPPTLWSAFFTKKWMRYQAALFTEYNHA